MQYQEWKTKIKYAGNFGENFQIHFAASIGRTLQNRLFDQWDHLATALVYQISRNRFFFGTWLTLIFRNFSGATPFRGLNRFTCRPTLIFLVRAPCGNTACTCGTTVLETIPPSGPMACTSWRMRETTAKYCGKSYVTKRQIRLPASSSVWLASERKTNHFIFLLQTEFNRLFFVLLFAAYLHSQDNRWEYHVQFHLNCQPNVHARSHHCPSAR